jgi:Fe-S cluster assembly iron-binding protein IscA
MLELSMCKENNGSNKISSDDIVYDGGFRYIIDKKSVVFNQEFDYDFYDNPIKVEVELESGNIETEPKNLEEYCYTLLIY